MKKILLADDDESVSQMLGQVLELEHYQVLRCRSGRQTAAMFIAESPELVLLDLNMPDRSGWEVFDLIHRTHPSVPVIIITALSQQQERATNLGIVLMEKPLDIPLLLEMIRDSLGAFDVGMEQSSGHNEQLGEMAQPDVNR
jgi:DNA-binding response OmpR family regulator